MSDRRLDETLATTITKECLDLPMLLARHVDSSWYRLASGAINWALSSPYIFANSAEIDPVERIVP
jgi:hypothetical protein